MEAANTNEGIYALADGEGFETALRSVTTPQAAELILKTVSDLMDAEVVYEETKDD